jgi:hypothetical protein
METDKAFSKSDLMALSLWVPWHTVVGEEDRDFVVPIPLFFGCRGGDLIVLNMAFCHRHRLSDEDWLRPQKRHAPLMVGRGREDRDPIRCVRS